MTDFLGHLDDWRVAHAYLLEAVPTGPLIGAGFSYGARSLAALLRPDRQEHPEFDGLLLLAPATRVPRTKRDFGSLLLGRPISDAALDGEVLQNLRALVPSLEVLVGEHDVVAPPEDLSRHLPRQAHLVVLPGLNHFFSRDRGAGRLAEEIFRPAVERALVALLEP